jgi:signal transduction histidine kinase
MILLSVSGFWRYRQRRNIELRDSKIHEREQSLRAVIQSAESERARIARELHDGAVQEVAALKMSWESSVIRGNANADTGAYLDRLARQLRELSHKIMPMSLKGSGLKAALQSLFNQAQGQNGILINFESSDLSADLPDEMQVSIFRICQELLQNTLKHARATVLEVQLFCAGNTLVLVFEDNGVGMPDPTTGSGLGLTNLKARAIQINGQIDFSSSPQGGLLVTLRAPITAAG